MNKKSMTLGLTKVSLFILGACAPLEVSRPQAVEFESSKAEQAPPSVKSSRSSERSSTTSSSLEAYREDLAEQRVDSFLKGYYHYDSLAQKVAQSQKFCTPQLQKSLHLVPPPKDVQMKSELLSKNLYQNAHHEFLAVIDYRLNGNQMTPEVVQLTVEKRGAQYWISQFHLPLKK